MIDVGSLGFAVVAMILSLRAAAWRRRWRRIGGFATVVALLVVAHVEVTYTAARAARLLFSTDVFMERRAGTETRLLPFLDDGRLLASEEGERGTYTLWKHHGVQYELRENGIPLGTYCGRSDVCPQFSGLVLTAALPLALHEAPRHVLILGLGSGSTLAAALEFPVADVTCVERDGRLVELLNHEVWPSGFANPKDDNRVRFVELDPACAVQSAGGAFDAIVADTEGAGVATGTPYFTREFYAAASRQLAEDGIFAQRFQYVDFGPWPVRSMLATLKSVFSQVAAVEAGGGDLVLLATNSPRDSIVPTCSSDSKVRRSAARFHTSGGTGRSHSISGPIGARSATRSLRARRSTRRRTACSPTDCRRRQCAGVPSEKNLPKCSTRTPGESPSGPMPTEMIPNLFAACRTC